MGAWQRGLPWGVLKSEGSVPYCRYQRALEKFSFSILLMQMEATVKSMALAVKLAAASTPMSIASWEQSGAPLAL